MSSTSENNKRIAKNTLFLYVRMLLIMAVTFYTSRVILQVLGVEDFGIYNVVGGVIAMLGFLTSSLGAASSRYITYDLGKGDMMVIKKTFGNILSIHFLLAVVVFLIGETIGLWFVSTQLQIPAERATAAMWVYQFSIFSSMLAIISVPYNATIIAHEKMSAFAFISIVDATLKLFIVYLLVLMPFDKLIVYSVLYFCVQAFIRMLYGVYCTRHFEETRTRPIYDHKVFKEILAFSGWTMNGNLAAIGQLKVLKSRATQIFDASVRRAAPMLDTTGTPALKALEIRAAFEEILSMASTITSGEQFMISAQFDSPINFSKHNTFAAGLISATLAAATSTFFFPMVEVKAHNWRFMFEISTASKSNK